MRRQIIQALQHRFVVAVLFQGGKQFFFCFVILPKPSARIPDFTAYDYFPLRAYPQAFFVPFQRFLKFVLLFQQPGHGPVSVKHIRCQLYRSFETAPG